MFRDRKDVWDKLSELWKDPKVPIYDTQGIRYAIFSDIHLGNGSNADDFTNNEFALMKAFDYYRENGFTVILLGDIEELWQFDLAAICQRYDAQIYHRLRAFPKGHVIRVYGNHDYEWGGFIDPVFSNGAPVAAPEAVKLKGKSGTARILLVHGHQGTIESDKFSWFSRFWVRVFSFVEPFAKSIGLYSTSTATKSQIARDYERTLYQWAKANDVILICGHSHRAIFAARSHAENLSDQIAKLEAENIKRNLSAARRLENTQKIHSLQDQLDDEKSKGRLIEPTDPGKEPLPLYFNTGCGVFSDGLTDIEIADGQIRLVKWNRDSSPKDLGRQIYHEDQLNI